MDVQGCPALTVCCERSLLALASKCLEEDMASFRTSIQEVVDELGEVRRKCALPGHKALVTRLLFILTRCSRLVLSGELPADGSRPRTPPPQQCSAKVNLPMLVHQGVSSDPECIEKVFRGPRCPRVPNYASRWR